MFFYYDYFTYSVFLDAGPRQDDDCVCATC